MKLKKRLSAIFYRALIVMTLMLPKITTAQLCDIVYVSAAIGNDANTGTAALPVATLSQALTLVGGSRMTIWMASGSYTQASIVNVTNGLTVEGGFAVAGSTWTKSTAQTTTITFSGIETVSGVRHMMAFKANGVSNWQLKDLSIITTNVSGVDPSNRGSSNYAVWVNNCANYTISRCNITVGNASAGSNGSVGASGANGNNGSQGGSGSCDGNYTCCFGSESAPGGNGGAGGQGAVGIAAGAGNSSTTNNNPGSNGTGRNGGGGGAGGKGGGFSGGNNAVAGSAGGGSGSTATNNGVGSSGAEGTTGGDGTNGANGLAGNNGTVGSNGPAGSNTGSFFVPGGQAGTGTDGIGGQGGAGGGGGGRQNGAFVNAGPGNGGAGGGGGGQGAIGGTGGFGGGGVFGIYTTSSTVGADITQNTIVLGTVGSGGIGGAGGTGGAGGAGGPRNATCTAEIGEGGAGGNGGSGGNGGQGGTGAAGVSAQLITDAVASSPSVTIPTVPVISSIHLGCTNSEITLTKASGTWTLPAGMNFIEDLNSGSSTYNTTSATAIVGVSNTGNYSPQVNGTAYQNYTGAFVSRALPALAASTPTIVCEGDVFPMSTPTTGTQFEWIIIPASGSTAAPTAIFTTSVASWPTPITGITGNYRVKLRVFTNCCGWSVPVYHNFSVVATSVGPIGTGATVCVGQTATLNATGSGLGNLTWYADPLGQNVLQTTVGSSTTFTTPSLTQSTVYYVAESVSGCLTTLSAIQAIVAPTPNTPAASSAPVCEGAPVTLNGFGTGGTLSWFNVATGGTALGSGANFNAGALAAGSYTFYLSESNGSCSSPRTAVGALVNVAPAAPTASGTTICSGNATTLSATASGTVQWYADAAMTTQLGSGASFNTPVLTSNTTYHVAQLNAAGCRSTSATPVTVTVTALPAAPAASGTSVCAGNAATLTATAGSGTLTWFADPSGSVSLATGASFTTPVLNQTTAFYVRETASGCQSPLTQVTATVNALPAAPAGSAPAVCAGASVILNGFGSGGTLSWFNTSTGGTALGSGNNFNAGALSAGSYTFYVSENNGSCSSARTPVAAQVNAAPAAPTASGTIICSGTFASLSATGSGAIQWYADAALTNLLATGSTFNTPALTTNTTYHVAASSSAGCLSTGTSLNVTVTALPAAPVATGATVCAGNTATLSASVGSGTLTWFADPSGSVSLATGASFTTPVLNQTTAFYVRETASGCQSPLTQVTATVNALPAAPAGSAPAVCAGAAVILNGFGSGGTLSWFNTATGGTALGSGNNFNAGILASGSYTFYVEESNGSCSSLRSPVAVVVNAAPAVPAASGTTICSGTSATLSATGSGVIQWYADASLTNLLATGSTFNTPALTTNTTYHVAASSSAGCLSSGTSLNVTVTALPAAPTATGATVCAGNTATLSASFGAGTLTWFADPGGSVFVGTGASFTTPVLNQTTAFYVCESASGCQGPLTQVTATVNSLPTAPAATAPAVCAGASVILNGFGSGGTLSWFNTATGGTALGSGNNFNAGALAAGSYTFYVEENNGSCSSVRTPVAVVVNAAPAAPTAQNDGPACEGDYIFLQASNVSGASYSWTGPNGFSSNQQTILILSSATTNAGVYSVAAIVNGCSSSAASTTVTVNSLPQISGAISNNGPLCEGENLTLTAPTTAGLTYEWTGPNGYSSTQAVSTVNNVNELDQQGFYTLVVTAANGCSSLPLSTLVEITSLPQAGMAISNGPLCTGSTLNLSVAEVFGASYNWSGPNAFTSTDRTPTVNAVTAAEAGIYTVTVSRNNCQTELDVNVIIDTIPNITVIADTTIASSDELLLYASGGVIYQWSPATFLSSPFSPTTIFAGAPAGTYTLTVFIQDAKGCSAEEQVNITVEASDNIVVTDLFTPNGDGVNETWVIEFLNNVGPYTLQVFSRGGLEVLNSQNYTNDWDGTHYKSGKKLPDGTYYYIIRTDANEYSGAVTIKR